MIERRPATAILLALVVSVGGIGWWQAQRTVPDPGRWLRVEPTTLEAHLGVVGRIQAARQVTLTAPFAGTLEVVSVQPGQPVRAGQALLALDTTQLAIELRQAQAERLKTRAALLELRGWDSGAEVTRARRAVQATRRDVERGAASLAETRQLFTRGIVARLEVDAAQQQLDGARQALVSAEDELVQALARGQGEQVQIAEMEAANAQARYEALQRLQARRVVRAPFAGLVVAPLDSAQGAQTPIQVGEAVAQGTPLLALQDLHRLQVLAAVPQMDVEKVKEGLGAQVRVQGLAETVLAGHVEQVGLQAQQEQGAGAWFELRIALDERPDPVALGVRLGMSAQVQIRLRSTPQAVVLPLEALHGNAVEGYWVMFRRDAESVARQAPVRVDLPQVAGVQVQGLEAGWVWVAD